MEVMIRDTCVVEAVEARSALMKCCHPELEPPKLPEFSKLACENVIYEPVRDCCGSSTLTIFIVLFAVLALLIFLLLVLRHFKRKLSRVAIDITNVTGTKKATSDVKLVGVTIFSVHSNGVSCTNKESQEGSVAEGRSK